ncbi:methyltransferase family protein [Aquabacterium sp.]|uniref:methyltransferase family protein n=1 Tax=Aquabacterium sp. TaxID=1872578 RepID=UPI003D6D4B80
MAKHDGADKYSGLVISIGSTILQLAAFALTFYAPWNIAEPEVFVYFWAGLALIVTGMLLRMHCWRVLGEFFTPTVTIAKEHKVVDKGAYKWVRHPSYSGAIMTSVGIGLALGNYGSIAVMVVGTIAVYIYRIEAEETALEGALGEAYAKFKSNRRRLIPFVY